MSLARLMASAAVAAEPEQLDEEFLEYLAEFANEEDDWTWFASDEEAPAAKAQPAAGKKQQATKSAEQGTQSRIEQSRTETNPAKVKP